MYLDHSRIATLSNINMYNIFGFDNKHNLFLQIVPIKKNSICFLHFYLHHYGSANFTHLEVMKTNIQM